MMLGLLVFFFFVVRFRLTLVFVVLLFDLLLIIVSESYHDHKIENDHQGRSKTCLKYNHLCFKKILKSKLFSLAILFIKIERSRGFIHYSWTVDYSYIKKDYQTIYQFLLIWLFNVQLTQKNVFKWSISFCVSSNGYDRMGILINWLKQCIPNGNEMQYFNNINSKIIVRANA